MMMAQQKIINSSPEIGRDFTRVNDFNKNFFCSEVKNILSLYERINNVWQHPLILNYNHCLICREIVNSPYSRYSLQLTHLQEEPVQFMKSHNIKYRSIPESQRRIKRRMIKSHENIVQYDIDKHFNSKYEEISSDTDIFYAPSMKPMSKKKKNKHNFKRKTVDITRNIFTTRKLRQISEKRDSKVFTPIMANKLIEQKVLKKRLTSTNTRTFFTNQNTVNITKTKSLMQIFKIITGVTESNQSEDDLNKGIKMNDIIISPNDNNISKLQYDDTYNRQCCDICLQEIQEKFVLGCGDFYCRKCIRGAVIDCIYNISLFNKLVCPKEICKEKLEERVIEKLLTNEEFLYYTKIKTRVDGLRNKSLIPCPYPDCEHYGSEKDIKKNLLYCGNSHFFCVKCLKGVVANEDSSTTEHICSTKQDETSRYLIINNFIKQCPNCLTWVQREPGGCNNMTCTNPWCNTEFCWICEGRYDHAHYKNPFSVCFGLGESDYKSKLSKYKSMRVLKCIVIFMLLIFFVLPIIVNLFSLVLICLYLITFVFDGATMKKIKIKRNWCRNIFNLIVYLFYFSLSIAFIPLGYIGLGTFIVTLPILIIVNKVKKCKEEDDYYS